MTAVMRYKEHRIRARYAHVDGDHQDRGFSCLSFMRLILDRHASTILDVLRKCYLLGILRGCSSCGHHVMLRLHSILSSHLTFPIECCPAFSRMMTSSPILVFGLHHASRPSFTGCHVRHSRNLYSFPPLPVGLHLLSLPLHPSNSHPLF
jgi:hypothetical protein